MPDLSIIIATHKRADILATCLEHLEKQSIADHLEVIVIHDGQDEKTDRQMAKSSWQIPIYYESIPKSQQGVARNRGVQKAQASTCLFINDDIFLVPRACELHLRAHQQSSTPIAVLGEMDWDPDVGITKAMQWLMDSGWQFGFKKLKRFRNDYIPASIQHLFSYTSNISVSTEIAKRTPFREDITLYGWEDIEWGMRLRQNGVHLFFEPRAKGLHHHRIDLPASLKRMEIIGESAVSLQKVVKEFDRLPKGWKKLAYRIFAYLPTMAGKHRKAFLKGIAKAKKSITG